MTYWCCWVKSNRPAATRWRSSLTTTRSFVLAASSAPGWQGDGHGLEPIRASGVAVSSNPGTRRRRDRGVSLWGREQLAEDGTAASSSGAQRQALDTELEAPQGAVAGLGDVEVGAAEAA